MLFLNKKHIKLYVSVALSVFNLSAAISAPLYTVTELRTPSSTASVVATSLGSNFAAGYSTDSALGAENPNAVIWRKNGSLYTVPNSAGFYPMNSSPKDQLVGYKINNINISTNTYVSYPAIYSSQSGLKIIPIENGAFTAINSVGTAVGTITDRSGAAVPIKWDKSRGTQLMASFADAVQSQPESISSTGKAVGWASLPSGITIPLIWNANNLVAELNPEFRGNAYEWAILMDISDAGIIVGSQAEIGTGLWRPLMVGKNGKIQKISMASMLASLGITTEIWNATLKSVNEKGEAVGTFDDGIISMPFIVGPDKVAYAIPFPIGANRCQPMEINSEGTVAGFCTNPEQGMRSIPVLWQRPAR